MYRHFFPDGPLFTRLLLRASGDGCVCARHCRQQEKGLPAWWLLIAWWTHPPVGGHWVWSELVDVLGAAHAQLRPVGSPGQAPPSKPLKPHRRLLGATGGSLSSL